MTTDKSVEKILAGFMGKRVNRQDVDKWNNDWGYSLSFNPHENKSLRPPYWINESCLRFKKSWDWAMPAWYKFVKLQVGSDYIVKHNELCHGILIAITTNDTPAEAAKLLAEAITWLKTLKTNE